MAGNNSRRAMLNTTINEEVLSNFREYCKTINCPMNIVLEAFMAQFAEGQFTFGLCNKKMHVELKEE